MRLLMFLSVIMLASCTTRQPIKPTPADPCLKYAYVYRDWLLQELCSNSKYQKHVMTIFYNNLDGVCANIPGSFSFSCLQTPEKNFDKNFKQ